MPLTGKWEQGSDPMYGTSACLGQRLSLSCLGSGSRSRGSTLVLVPAWGQVRVSPCPCRGQVCCSRSCPGGDLCSASKSPVSLCPVQTGLICLFAHSGD